MTVTIIEHRYTPDLSTSYRRPLFLVSVSAGFPSPADDDLEGKLDLNEHLIKHEAATFFVRVKGDSMIGAGIHSGDLLVVDRALASSNYALYGDMSARVMTILKQFSPQVEVYSIDEAFLDLCGCGGGDLKAYGHRIRHTLKQWTGIPISIGIGATKTLAKLANRLAKRADAAQGVFDLTESKHQDDVLQSTPVKDIWGIGRSYSRLLQMNGIATALALRETDDRWIRKHMGVVGLRIVWELRGMSCLPLQRRVPPKKSVMARSPLWMKCGKRWRPMPPERLRSCAGIT